MSALLLSIVGLRLFSGALEIIAALLIYKGNNLEYALKVNALLASIGPLIFLGAMSLGLAGLAQGLPYNKLFLIYGGVALIFVGLRL